ncbi:hypothetical protein Bca4012_052187 [Brassica carinata]|uniref:Uncharacterized protein n=1 Tax=Brassica carinata TaxID=52824 RepID=A0A8X7UM49_BRACI|nr:hypothetical protein Bca52824_054749 [Brassica carinata]
MLLFLHLNSVLGLSLESHLFFLIFASLLNSKKRPPGVKASKASGKKTFDPDKQVEEFERIWKIKQKEIDAKEHLSKMSLLDSLIGKKEPLLEYEESLKKKLINDLF